MFLGTKRTDLVSKTVTDFYTENFKLLIEIFIAFRL